jgi:hypothetical protein
MLAWWLTRDSSAVVRLAARGGIFGAWTAWTFFNQGLEKKLRSEMIGRLPSWGRSCLVRFGIR